MTHAQSKNLETCAHPGPCHEPATVTNRHALVDEEGTIDTIIELGYCAEHVEEA